MSLVFNTANPLGTTCTYIFSFYAYWYLLTFSQSMTHATILNNNAMYAQHYAMFKMRDRPMYIHSIKLLWVQVCPNFERCQVEVELVTHHLWFIWSSTLTLEMCLSRDKKNILFHSFLFWTIILMLPHKERNLNKDSVSGFENIKTANHSAAKELISGFDKNQLFVFLVRR